MEIKKRLSGWLANSIGNRITLFSVVTALALVLILGTVTFPLFFSQAWENFSGHGKNKLERISDTFYFRLSATQEALDQLSRNSFIVNSFVDSTGREVYLQPTLRDFRLPIDLPAKIVLFDANVDPFAGNILDYAAIGKPLQPLAAKAFKTGKQTASVHTYNGRQTIALAIPVYYPPASAHEGVLLAVLDASSLFSLPVNTLEESDCLTVTSTNVELLGADCGPQNSWNTFSDVVMNGPRATGRLGITIKYTESSWALIGQLTVVFLAYILVGIAAVMVAFILSRRLAGMFAGQLKSLSEASNRLAESPNAQARVSWKHPDEIGEFVGAFNTMVDRLQEFQASLEARVAERTRELTTALQRADAASRAKSDFLASMSHELRTPLNAILGFSQLFMMNDELSTQSRKDAREIERAGKHLLALINDLIDLARIETGKLELSLEAVRVNDVLKEGMSLMKPIAGEQGIELIEATDACGASLIRADYNRLRQVVINFLSNAVKYNRPSGKVWLSCEHRDDWLCIKVTDTGPGIPNDKQGRIFNAFDRLGEERSSVEGTGIGLVITKQLVEAMGGRIGFSSTEGEGSTFWAEFQTHDAGVGNGLSASVDPPIPASETLSRSRVLYIEDNPTNLRMMHQIIARRPELELSDAHTAELGLKLAIADPPDLILMDINLPGNLDGYGALKSLKSNPRTAHIPVVAVTANAMNGDKERGLEAGFADYVVKPINIQLLLETLDRLLPVRNA